MLFTKNLLPVDISSEDSYYILQFLSLASRRKKLSPSSPVLLLQTVFGADQCNSSAVPLLHTGVPRSKHPAPPIPPFIRSVSLEGLMHEKMAVALRCFFSYSDLSAVLHSSWAPKAFMVTVKKASQQIHQRGRPKAFELIYMTLSLLCDASIDISFLLQYSGVCRLNSKRCPFDLSSRMKTGVIVQRLWRSEII